jgi:hypothetical protein
MLSAEIKNVGAMYPPLNFMTWCLLNKAQAYLYLLPYLCRELEIIYVVPVFDNSLDYCALKVRRS